MNTSGHSMYPLDYLIEKFDQAVFDLATGQGDARSRLRDAYDRFWIIRLDDYPEHVRAERRVIDKLLTRLPAREGYVIQDNIRKMQNKTASHICALIVSVHAGLLRARTRST
jgi:hypothetical protein